MDQTSHFSLHVAVSGSGLPAKVKRQFRYILAGAFFLALMFSLLFSMTRFFERPLTMPSRTPTVILRFPSMP